MSKYMNQALFDVCVIKVIYEKLSTGIRYEDLPFISYVADAYKNDFQDTLLYQGQFIEVAEFLIKKYSSHGPIFLVAIQRAENLRMDLDDEMNKKNSIQKVFNGSWVKNGHKKPFERANIAITNIRSLLAFQLAKLG